eukprot:3614443-Alexandrium_andersonii.AAC.1
MAPLGAWLRVGLNGPTSNVPSLAQGASQRWGLCRRTASNRIALPEPANSHQVRMSHRSVGQPFA